MKWGFVLGLLGGCDIVLGLEERPAPPDFIHESRTHDDDGDGKVDALDLCPHLANGETRDFDHDGIGDSCDPHPKNPDDRYFFAFESGSIEGLDEEGQLVPDSDSVLLGAVTSPHAALVLPIFADVVHVEIDATIEAIAQPIVGWSELGLHTMHRRFSADNTERGDTCFLGRDEQATQPNYLEFDEDDVFRGEDCFRFDGGSLVGKRVVFRQARTPDAFRCEVTGQIVVGGNATRGRPDQLGKIAVSVDRMVVRLHYAWIVTPRP